MASDYESDAEQSPLPSMRRRDDSATDSDSDPLPTRRRGADAEDDAVSDADSDPLPTRRDPRGAAAVYDEESDGQGAAPGYDDDDDFDEEDLEEYEVVPVRIQKREVIEASVVAEKVTVAVREELEGERPVANAEGEEGAGEVEGEGEGEQGVEGKKENEPYAVPTAGAFYMHDDRFQENGRGRGRHMPGVRKLWETKDDRAWVHDRFEEMNLHDVRHSEGRQMSRGGFRGRGRGRGRTRGTGRGYGSGNRSQSYYDRSNHHNNYDGSNDRSNYDQSNDHNNYDQSNDHNNYDRDNSRNNYDRGNGRSNYNRGNNRINYVRNKDLNNHDRTNDRTNNRTNYDSSNGRSNYDRSNGRNNFQRSNDRSNDRSYVPKSVRGRGPTRYVPAQRNNSEAPRPQQKQSARPQELTTKNTIGRKPQPSNVQPNPAIPRKHVFASNLNSASPPFYPSGSSNRDLSENQRSDVLVGSVTQPDSFLKGQSSANSHDMLYMNTSHPVITGASIINPQLQPPGSSLLSPRPIQSSYSGIPGNGTNISANYQQTPMLNQVARVPSQIHSPVQQRSFQASPQPSLRSSTQQPGQQPGSENQASSSPQALASDSFDVERTEADSPSGTSKSSSMVEKGRSGVPGSEKGSFLYNGAQIIGAAGATGLPHSDQGFPATPALLPVMQFGGQHHGGLGVPAVGMALPGYVAQSQLGFGNSEMTWLPMLAGAAGALGASYPYIALDGYYNRSSGPTSSVSPSETSATRPLTASKPQGPDTVSDEFTQRQSKPRRYSEMNFGQ